MTRFPVIWLVVNDYEGNVAGLNHVIKKYPDSPSYHRPVASVAMSHYILNHSLTTSWVSTNRANEFRKYTEPVHIDDMQETRCFPRCTRNGVASLPYFSMTSEDGIDAKVSAATYPPRSRERNKTLTGGGLS